MEVTVAHQLTELLCALALGCAAGMLYDVLRIVRRHLPGAAVTAVCDLLFCSALGIALFVLALTVFQGRQRGILAIGVGVGGALYALALSRPTLYILQGLADVIAVFLRFAALPAVFLTYNIKKIAVFAKKLFNYGRKWYIFKERHTLNEKRRHRKLSDRRNPARETSRNNYKNTRLCSDHLPCMDNSRSASRHSGSHRRA